MQIFYIIYITQTSIKIGLRTQSGELNTSPRRMLKNQTAIFVIF